MVFEWTINVKVERLLEKSQKMNTNTNIKNRIQNYTMMKGNKSRSSEITIIWPENILLPIESERKYQIQIKVSKSFNILTRSFIFVFTFFEHYWWLNA